LGTAISESQYYMHTPNDTLWIKESECIRAFILKEFEALEPLCSKSGRIIITLEPLNEEDIHSLWMGLYHIWGFVVFHIDMKILIR
jgi:hypothetical protein